MRRPGARRDAPAPLPTGLTAEDGVLRARRTRRGPCEALTRAWNPPRAQTATVAAAAKAVRPAGTLDTDALLSEKKAAKPLNIVFVSAEARAQPSLFDQP